MNKVICEKCGSISYFDHYFGCYVCSSCHHSQAKDTEKVHCPSCGCELSLVQWGNKGYAYAGNHAIDCYVGMSKLFDTPEAALTAAQKRWVDPNLVLTLNEVRREAAVWLEVKFPSGKTAIYPEVFVSYFDCEYSFMGSARFEESEYGTVWRCWLRKPTDAERAAVPWEND